MTSIAVSPLEREQGTLSPANLARAGQAIKVDGYVTLENIVAADSIAALRERMLEDIAKLVSRPNAPFNWNRGNLQQAPPPFPPYMFRDILVNDLVIQVTKSILGSGLKNMFYSGNTALFSEDRQPVHADMGQLWPNLEQPHPAYALGINVPLVDVSAENGGTEIWPGTHLDPAVVLQDEDLTVPPDALERRRATLPPHQLEIAAGSVLIRDVRMWHAGMPNRTLQPRPMIAMCHFVKWWSPLAPIRFPKGAEHLLEHPELHTHAEFVDDTIDYIAVPVAHEYPGASTP